VNVVVVEYIRFKIAADRAEAFLLAYERAAGDRPLEAGGLGTGELRVLEVDVGTISAMA
jgi:hypothetical protein